MLTHHILHSNINKSPNCELREISVLFFKLFQLSRVKAGDYDSYRPGETAFLESEHI